MKAKIYAYLMTGGVLINLLAADVNFNIAIAASIALLAVLRFLNNIAEGS